MTDNIKQRVKNGKIEYFDETNGWVGKDEYYDIIPDNNLEVDEDDELTPDYLLKQSGESEQHYKDRIRDLYENMGPDDED